MTLKISTRVLPGNRIEVTAPQLKEGDCVEVIVLLPEQEAPSDMSVLDYLDSLPPGPRLFKTPEDADEYLRQERDSWE